MVFKNSTDRFQIEAIIFHGENGDYLLMIFIARQGVLLTRVNFENWVESKCVEA